MRQGRRRDTQRAIDEDAAKTAAEYWGCERLACDECPALVGGRTPRERYGTARCGTAMKIELLQRRRELSLRWHPLLRRQLRGAKGGEGRG